MKYLELRYLKKLMLMVLSLFAILGCKEEASDVLKYVDPFISTEGDHGHWHPSALVPFGMVKLCPDTYPSSLTGDGDWAHSGYNYADTIIRGFSHLRTGSSGGGSIYDRAGLLSVMPFTSTKDSQWLASPQALFSKKTEKAGVGYYSVYLSEEDIQAELTATTYVGFHKYTFYKDDSCKLLLSGGKINMGEQVIFKKVDETTFEGRFKWDSGAYFVITFNHPLLNVHGIGSSVYLESRDSLESVICNFGKLKTPLKVKVALSFTGIAGARKNLEASCPEWDFDEVKLQAEDLWRNQLARIQVQSDNVRNKRIFYTSLYRTCFLPIKQSDIDGTYKGWDQKMHNAKGYIYYNGFAFWDSFRTKYPLYSLFCPDVYSDIVSSIYDTYRQANNWNPFPESDHKPHNSPLFRAGGLNGFAAYSTVRHEHMLMVMTDAYFKGLFHDSLSIKEVYPYLKQEALLQMPEKYDSIGYIPARPDQTGEYCWDNWCLAQIAKETGKEDDFDYFSARANYWKNTWDSDINFFRARSEDGTWLDFPEDPTTNREKYTYEGSKWHWRWNALHDIQGMVQSLGGKEAFVKTLDYFFENDLYTAGNQIDLHAPFLFNMAGAPWLTQKWVNQLLTKPTTQLYGTHGFFKEPVLDYIYKDTPDGFLEEMDGDFGCMSAWYNLGAIGLYQVCPGDTKFQISTPIFEQVSLEIINQHKEKTTFKIITRNFSEENIYIQSVRLNGEVLNRWWLDYSEIAHGGTLEVVLSDKITIPKDEEKS